MAGLTLLPFAQTCRGAGLSRSPFLLHVFWLLLLFCSVAGALCVDVVRCRIEVLRIVFVCRRLSLFLVCGVSLPDGTRR